MTATTPSGEAPDLREAVARTKEAMRREAVLACFDPGAVLGPRGERSTDEWRADAVMKVVAAPLRAENESLRADLAAAIARAEEAERTLPERLKPAIAASLKEMGLCLAPETWIAGMREATANLRSKVAIAADLTAKADKGEAWWGHAHAANDAVAEAKEALALAALTTPEHPHGD